MRRALVAALPLLLITAACGHESPDTTPKSTNGSSEQGTDTNAQPAAPGEFGTLKGVCGRGDGKTVPSDARGVTDDEIQVGVLNDATSTLAPGLGAEYLAVAKAFTEWCNAAGGINGRKIKFVTRDAKVTEAAARIVDACQSDFMLVGGATPFDAPTVEPREECDLGAIPAYAASPEATTSKLQALPTRVPAKQANVAAIRLLENEFGDAFERTGMLAVDVSSLLDPALAVREALPKVGVDIVSFQKLPLEVASYRTYVQPLVGKVDAVIPPPAPDAGFFRAMNDVDYTPKVLLDPVGNTYSQDLAKAFADAPVDAPYYLASEIFPLEMADQNPATKLAMDLTKKTGTKLPIDAGMIPAWASWLLFARSASECTDKLTVDCVIEKATSDHAYTAGGLIAPVDLSDPTSIGACRVILSLTADGFTYEPKITKPTDGDGVFNCDDANVVRLDG